MALKQSKVDGFKYKVGGPRIQRLWDTAEICKGLGLEVFPSGRKSWIFRYTFEGKQRIITLAPCVDRTLEEAQELARECRKAVQAGQAPKGIRQTKREPPPADPEPDALTVRGLWERYSATRYYLTRSQDFRNGMASFAKVYLLPNWGDLPAAALPRSELRTLVNELIEGEKEGAARGVLNRARILFNYAMEEELVESSPADHIKPRFTTTGRREAWLETDADLLRAWNLDAPLQVRLMARWLLLTGCRRDEAREATWDQVDQEAEVWRVPKTKNGHDLALPLLPAMQDILRELRATFGATPHLFPATTTNFKAIPRASFDYSLRVATDGNWSAHVLRHTVESHLKELGIDEERRDLVLNHVRGSSGERYGHGEALGIKREALTPWHAKLTALKPPLRVVPNTERKAA
ncbi:MAG TPA: integrase arm-type DNA-binding domain-containing protein [Lamprocystis sp. (in: g-proteobacteria)]|nr:integrase arm-type DNA-binding domain-containing protein [Lamprocystis sp. (in: g-proteobacteria)]